MKKEFNVVGLDCAHCALTLEKYIETVSGVKSCMVNFATSKVFVEIDEDDSKETIKNIYNIAKQTFPNVKLSEEQKVSKDEKSKKLDLILYAIGVVIGLLVLFVPMSILLFYSLLIISGLLMGYKTYFKAVIQLRNLKLNENTLVTLSIIGAIAVGESAEGLMVIALYTLGKMLESKAVNYSRKSISSLISSQPEYAIKVEDGEEKRVSPDEVRVGDIIIVKAGEKIALDGVVVDGKANVDKKHLTGESMPVAIKKGIEVESGSIVLDSVIKLKVLKEYKDSTVSKILELVSNATNKKSKTESFISKFASWYTLGVLICSVIVFGITMLVLKDWNVAIYRGLIFLVVSCPCAFAISVPLSYFSGIGRCSKEGILVKGSIYLDECSGVKNIVFDKTGTLTTGSFMVEKIELYDSEITEDELLKIIVAGEQNSLHPTAIALCEYYGKKSELKIKNYKEIVGFGIEFVYLKDKYKVGRANTEIDTTCVDIVKNNKIIAKIVLKDEIKKNVISAVKDLKNNDIKTIMLTGDNGLVAKTVADSIGIDEFKAELYPEDKFKIIEQLKDENKTMFVGDGINDAPALTLSSVGVSMGIMGSDATIEASDVVIADDNISKIPELINISKFTKNIVRQNIIFACITKLTFLTLGAIGITGMLFAVFADVGVTLIAILNSLRVLRHKLK